MPASPTSANLGHAPSSQLRMAIAHDINYGAFSSCGALAKSTGMLTPDTMFERYGGLAFVTRFVLSFYDRVLASIQLASFFANSDMQRLVEHQAKFISTVMGGPTSYSNAVLREVHEHLDIDDQAFDEMIFLFKATLKDFKIADIDAEAIITDLNARRMYIVNGRSKKM
jgi:hemoglobin